MPGLEQATNAQEIAPDGRNDAFDGMDGTDK